MSFPYRKRPPETNNHSRNHLQRKLGRQLMGGKLVALPHWSLGVWISMRVDLRKAQVTRLLGKQVKSFLDHQREIHGTPLEYSGCSSGHKPEYFKVDVGRGAKIQTLAVKWGFPTKPQ